MLKNITTNIMVENVLESVKFYTEVLWFPLIFTVDDEKNTGFWEILETWNIIFAQVWDENNKLMIQEKNNLGWEIKELKWVEIGASMSFYFTVENIESYYEKCKNADCVIRELETSWYGMKEFCITDNSGYVIMFGEEDTSQKF